MTIPQDDAGPLVDEEARESAVRRLREAYAEEAITHAEMDERLGQVLSATRHGELASVLDALPGEARKTGDHGDDRRGRMDGSGGAERGGCPGSSRSSPPSGGSA